MYLKIDRAGRAHRNVTYAQNKKSRQLNALENNKMLPDYFVFCALPIHSESNVQLIHRKPSRVVFFFFRKNKTFETKKFYFKKLKCAQFIWINVF